MYVDVDIGFICVLENVLSSLLEISFSRSGCSDFFLFSSFLFGLRSLEHIQRHQQQQKT